MVNVGNDFDRVVLIEPASVKEILMTEFFPISLWNGIDNLKNLFDELQLCRS